MRSIFISMQKTEPVKLIRCLLQSDLQVDSISLALFESEQRDQRFLAWSPSISPSLAWEREIDCLQILSHVAPLSLSFTRSIDWNQVSMCSMWIDRFERYLPRLCRTSCFDQCDHRHHVSVCSHAKNFSAFSRLLACCLPVSLFVWRRSARILNECDERFECNPSHTALPNQGDLSYWGMS